MVHKIALLGILIAASCFAQFSGRLTGTVVDASGAPVPEADIALQLPGSEKALLTTTTSADGTWHLAGVRPAAYDLTAQAKAFVKTTLHNLPVDAARETAVPTITLQLPAVAQSIDVEGSAETVQTGNAEISSTITTSEIQKLPIADRDPLALIQTQAGVVYNGNSGTVINGMRTSFANVTLDGINIQDNYIRDNALDYSPNRPLLGQVRQVTLVTSNSNAAAPGGSAQVAMETPSGTNTIHATAFWFNRNSHFAANDWFNNQADVERSRLNQNQAGVSVGGPIQKDKLFFFANYEAVRTNQQAPATNTVLTPDARSGIFTYRDTGGGTRKVNLLTLRNASIDPYVQNLLGQLPQTINSFDTGDSTSALLRNTAGYRFNQRSNETRDNITARGDYNLSVKNVFSGSYIWNRDNTDVADHTFAVIPKEANPNHSHFASLGWRWTPTASLTNELRGGFNLAPGDFTTSQKFGPFLATGFAFTDPVDESLPQGRATNTYALSDNAAWQRGKHYLQFGFHMQKIRVRAYNAAGTLPTYTVGMGTGQSAIVRADLPGSRGSDVTAANNLLASLAGFVDSYAQTFNITNRTSGFVNGAPETRNFRLDEYDIYLQDNWKPLRNVTLTLGLRWNLPGVADETDSLGLLPILKNNDPVQTLLSNSTLGFAGASAGRPWYKRPRKDFAPNVGLAWDPFGNGKTAFRAGYSINFVNDQALAAPKTILGINSGLSAVSSKSGLTGRLSASLPAVVTPVYQMPITAADNYALNSFNAVGTMAPNLRTPYVQQYTAGIQQEFLHTVFEARFVGNHMVQGFRTFDYNQVNIRSNGFLADFLRAQNNGYLAQARNGTFNPAYNAAIPGSQPLPVFAQLKNGGSLNTGTVRNLLQSGEPGALAATYAENGTNGTVAFFANPYALGADMLTNYSNSSYNSLQVEARHRSRAGFDFTVNYTFSKVLSDTAGDTQSRIEHFLDSANPGLERSRANFDLNHSFKASGVYELPFGHGHRLNLAHVDRAISGWSLGTIASWQSGAPFSILSSRGTLNRADGSRSYYNTANTALNGSQLSNVVNFQMTGNGPYIVPQSAINPGDGSGVNADGSANFTGQLFNNPTAGTLGALQRRYFSGPTSFNYDISLQKSVKVTEHQSVEIRMDALNVFNHPTFWVGDQDINSTTFGALASTLNLPRVVQFGLKYQF